MENIKGLYKNLENGTQLWDVSNAIMVILLWILIVYLIIIGLSCQNKKSITANNL